jgi:ATPase subunit of ABC transporter with duplicated ATPase domains
LENKKAHQRQFEAQQLKTATMKKFIERFRKDEKQASLVQSRIKELKKLEEDLLVAETELKDFRFDFSDPEKLKQDAGRLSKEA